MLRDVCQSPITAERKHLTLAGQVRVGAGVLPKEEAIEEISMSFPGRPEGQCLPRRNRASKTTEARRNLKLEVVMELQAVEQGDER